jgi:hypothetical protein
VVLQLELLQGRRLPLLSLVVVVVFFLLLRRRRHGRVGGGGARGAGAGEEL